MPGILWETLGLGCKQDVLLVLGWVVLGFFFSYLAFFVMVTFPPP